MDKCTFKACLDKLAERATEGRTLPISGFETSEFDGTIVIELNAGMVRIVRVVDGVPEPHFDAVRITPK